MIDSRLALLAKTADVPGAVQQHRAGKLNNLLGQAKLDQIPIENERADRVADINQQNANTASTKAGIDYQKLVNEMGAEDTERLLQESKKVLQVTTQRDWDIYRSTLDAEDQAILPSVYGDEQFQDFYRQNEMLVNATLDPEKPDRTLVEIADPNSPTGTRFVKREDAVNQPGKPGSGMSLTSDGQGGFTLTQGRGVTGGVRGMAKPVVNKTQEDVMAKTVTLDRLEEVGASFDPKFLTVSNRLGNSWTAVKEKYQIGEISPSEEKELAEFTQFKSEALNNLNLYIKDITGAAMSEAEAGRIRKAMPDPGEGIFDGDSPTEFISKYKSAINSLKIARARQQYALKNGQNWEDISLASMKDILKQEQARFFQEAGWSDDLPEENKQQIVQQVKTRLKNEYGF